jgi:hypothetical protein
VTACTRSDLLGRSRAERKNARTNELLVGRRSRAGDRRRDGLHFGGVEIRRTRTLTDPGERMRASGPVEREVRRPLCPDVKEPRRRSLIIVETHGNCHAPPAAAPEPTDTARPGEHEENGEKFVAVDPLAE